jgi:hypothetical protein
MLITPEKRCLVLRQIRGLFHDSSQASLVLSVDELNKLTLALSLCPLMCLPPGLNGHHGNISGGLTLETLIGKTVPLLPCPLTHYNGLPRSTQTPTLGTWMLGELLDFDAEMLAPQQTPLTVMTVVHFL